MKLLKKTFAVAGSLVLATTLVGCGGQSASTASTATATADDSLNVVMTTAPVGLHPLKTNDSASTDINIQIYETLYRRTIDGKGYTPLLAKEVPSCDEAGTTCTIKLQENVKFHDGTPFNSEAVKYTLEKIKDKDYGSARASIAASIDTVETPDDTTVVLHLKYADGVLLAKLAHTNSAIVSPTADQSKDLMVDPVGTGPYKFVNSVSGSEYVLTRNDEYWGKKPEIKDIKFNVITDISTALSRLETKEADLLKTVPESSLARAQALQGFTTVTNPSSAIVYLAIRPNSSKNPVTANLDFRKAVVMAIDANAYVASVLGGNGSHSQSIFGPTVLGYKAEQEDFGYKYDLEAAKKLVADNNFADEEITFLINNRATTVALAEFIQASLKAAGFNKINIVQEEWSAFLSDTKQANAFDMTILTWSNVTGDGTEFLEPNFDSSVLGDKSDRVRYQNADFDALVEASKKTMDKDARLQALNDAAKMIEEDAVAAPLYNSYQIYTYNSGYDNVVLDPGASLYIGDITIKK